MLEFIDGFAIGGCLPDEAGTSFPQLNKTASVSRPASVDLRAHCSPVEDQRRVGSCVGNAVAGALEYHQIKNGRSLRDLSRLFIYYNARRLEGKEMEDTGCSRRKALASVLAYGVCPETMWPYQEAMVTVAPTRDCYSAAQRFLGVEFAELTHGNAVKDVLASGLPVVFGMGVPASLSRMNYENWIMRAPDDGQWEPSRGGHAMLIVGYDDTENMYLIRNSWGTGWGRDGYMLMHHDVLMHYTQPPVYLGERPFVIGAIAESRAYEVSGLDKQAFMSTATTGASPQVQDEISALRQSLAEDLESSLNKTRQSIRDRLRGPGAGGGY
ncbi:C1 family peptidase [Henriciella sp. AS95]|uniref:C1 family peptidase n=1 Tax=Henriciella sp. AS95 TaxID=3135782 RepID=UPI00317EDDE4